MSASASAEPATRERDHWLSHLRLFTSLRGYRGGRGGGRDAPMTEPAGTGRQPPLWYDRLVALSKPRGT